MRILIVGASRPGPRPGRRAGAGRGNDHRRIAQGAHGPDGGAVLRAALDRGGPVRPEAAAARIADQAPAELDAILCNVGVWEDKAFTDDYDFLADSPQQIRAAAGHQHHRHDPAVATADPRLLGRAKPQLVLTGSTSGLRAGRPEVAFGASKAALSGIADALRERFRAQRLAVTCLQLGYLNTEDGLAVARDEASRRGEGTLAPVHDVVAMVRALLSLSDASFVRELVLPAILDERF